MHLKYGYSYYPEHCRDFDEILKDIELISASGANTVRMGEFAWDIFEPSEGIYNFDLFEKTINELGSRGIYTVLCTPTSCPPAWLMEKHPEIHYYDHRGVKRPFGARHHYCYNSEIYKAYSEKIVSEMAKRFGENPYVTGFQIGNEFAQESSGRCHCKHCAAKFRKYLENKYGTVIEFNKKCATNFWGGSYTSFSQVELPIANSSDYEYDHIRSYYDNPGLRINYERFCSDSFKEYSDLQAETIRRYSKKTITSNSTGFGTNLINYYDFYQNLDVFGLDIYPSLVTGDNDLCEFTYSFGRAMKDKEFWIMEFAVGGGHALWGKEGRLQPYPGAIRLCAFHAFTCGASLLCHFQYKTFRGGAEQLNYALLDADRVPRRRYFEFQETVKTLEKYENILESTKNKRAEIALVFDYDSMWALKMKPINHSFDYISYSIELFKNIRSLGYDVDIISPNDDFSKYCAVILPTMIMMDKPFAEKLSSYVNGGGALLSTFLTSVKDSHNVAGDSSLPCYLTDLFGVSVGEVEPVFEDSVSQIDINIGGVKYSSLSKYWIDCLEVKSAASLGEIADTYRKGTPVITVNNYGSGKAVYLGTMIEKEPLLSLLEMLLDGKNIKTEFTVSKDVSVVSRENEKNLYHFIFNYSKESIKICLNGEYRDALSDETLTEINIPAFDFACVKKDK